MTENNASQDDTVEPDQHADDPWDSDPNDPADPSTPATPPAPPVTNPWDSGPDA
jgi:hypothetical protein